VRYVKATGKKDGSRQNPVRHVAVKELSLSWNLLKNVRIATGKVLYGICKVPAQPVMALDGFIYLTNKGEYSNG